ncbi:hypothetical protein JZU56_01505 [bacterium]|jgi:hypothetical protein|nr:hypothetical protein [bacterium]
MNFRFLFSLLSLLAIVEPAFGQARPGTPPPSDAEIAARIQGDGKGKLSVGMTDGKHGELEWNAKEQTWYFQRGYLVRRAANLPDYPKAVLVVGGLAVYRYVGGRWTHSRDLVTFNRYEGMPQPDNDSLLAIVRATPERALAGDWHQVVGGFKSLSIPETPGFKWHNANSFSFPIIAAYTLKWDAVHPVECTREWNVRVYRRPDGKWGNPSGTRSRNLTSCRS